MQLEIPNIDKIIKENELPLISNPVYLEEKNTPTKNGIFSYELFGRPGSPKRKFQFGYVNLGKRFINPIAYIQISKLFSKLPSIIQGSKKFKINETNGILVEDENGGTGIDFLYKNFSKINFDDRDVKSRKVRNELLTIYDKNEIFCENWLIIPPFYYDINLRTSEGARSIDELGSLYIRLISLTNILKTEGAFFTSYNAEFNIQSTLNDIYRLLANKISMKQGLIQRDLLGKNIDYTVRGVISAPKIRNANSYKDQAIPYNHVGVPLYMLATTFFPFVVAEMEKFCQELRAYKVFLSNGAGHEILASTLDSLSSANFEKVIKLYTKSPENRVQEFKVTTTDKSNPLAYFSKALGRPFTVTDLLYIAVSAAIKDKNVILVRYPYTDYRSVCGFKPVILTTEKTTSMQIGNSETYKWDRYPDLKSKNISWIDTIQPNLSVISGLGGDFDGDTVAVKGVYTQEANIEITENSMKPMMLLGPSGENSRSVIKDAFLSLYEMTK